MYASSGPMRARYGDSTTTSSVDAGPRRPPLPELIGLVRVVGDVDGDGIGADRVREGDGLQRAGRSRRAIGTITIGRGATSLASGMWSSASAASRSR